MFSMKTYKRNLIAVLCVLLFSLPSVAIKYSTGFNFEGLPMNLEEMVMVAGTIFVGSCTNVIEDEYDPISRLKVNKYSFKGKEFLKGKKEKNITYKQWSSSVNKLNFEIGKKYLIFLYPESNLGLRSPVSFSNGVFIFKKKGILFKKEFVVNVSNNFGLYRNIKTGKTLNLEKKEKLANIIQTASETKSAISYSVIRDCIKYYVQLENKRKKSI